MTCSKKYQPGDWYFVIDLAPNLREQTHETLKSIGLHEQQIQALVQFNLLR